MYKNFVSKKFNLTKLDMENLNESECGARENGVKFTTFTISVDKELLKIIVAERNT